MDVLDEPLLFFFFSPFLLEMKKTSVVSWRTWDS